jgi:hypothetical protein
LSKHGINIVDFLWYDQADECFNFSSDFLLSLELGGRFRN